MATLIAHGHELARIPVTAPALRTAEAAAAHRVFLVVFADGAILIGARGRYKVWARVGVDNLDALGSVIAFLRARYDPAPVVAASA